MDWNIEKGQQGKNVLFRRFLWNSFLLFFLWQCLKLTPKMTKNPKISNFQRFYAFFDKISTVFVDSKVLRGQKETFRCPVGSFEEIIAVL